MRRWRWRLCRFGCVCAPSTICAPHISSAACWTARPCGPTQGVALRPFLARHKRSVSVAQKNRFRLGPSLWSRVCVCWHPSVSFLDSPQAQRLVIAALPCRHRPRLSPCCHRALAPAAPPLQCLDRRDRLAYCHTATLSHLPPAHDIFPRRSFSLSLPSSELQFSRHFASQTNLTGRT